MPTLEPKYKPVECSRRGQEIYERAVRPCMVAADKGKFAAIDVCSEEYELDRDDFTATERLLARRPKAQIWLVRVGDQVTYRLGSASFRG